MKRKSLFIVILVLVFSGMATTVQAGLPYQDAVLSEPSLISYYPVDGDPNTSLLVDIVGTNEGTIAGTGASIQAGVVGDYALEITANSWVNFGAVSDFDFPDGSGTVECLIQKKVEPATNIKSNLFCGWGGDPLKIRHLWCLKNATMGFDSRIAPNTWYQAYLPFTCNLDQWYHVAIVYDGGAVSAMYVNGAALPGMPTGQLLGDPGATYQFGSLVSTNKDQGFMGLVDELAVYSDALSASTILDHFILSPANVKAYAPVPDNGAEGPRASFTELSWALPATLCSGDDLTVDVWFGTDPTMATATKIVDGGTNTTSTTNFTVLADQTCYWAVDVTDPDTCGGGIPIPTEGDVWSFTTTPCDPPLEADVTGDCIVNLDDFGMVASQWLNDSN